MLAPSGVSRDGPHVRDLARGRAPRSGMPGPSGGRQIDRRERRRDVERDLVLLREHRDACRCRSCWRCRRWPRCGRRRRRRGRCRRRASAAPAMLSVMTVVSMPSRTSSQAVRRAPCRNGRVSSAKTAHLLALLHRGADDAERRAVAGGGERAGVAVRQHARLVRHDLGAVARRSRGSSRRPRRGSRGPRPSAAP